MPIVILCCHFKAAARNVYTDLERIRRYTKRKQKAREQYVDMLYLKKKDKCTINFSKDTQET